MKDKENLESCHPDRFSIKEHQEARRTQVLRAFRILGDVVEVNPYRFIRELKGESFCKLYSRLTERHSNS